VGADSGMGAIGRRLDAACREPQQNRSSDIHKDHEDGEQKQPTARHRIKPELDISAARLRRS
jgi:hypothetical protein